MRKRTQLYIILFGVLGVALVSACAYYVSWYNCLCYQAIVHPWECLPIDNRVLEHTSPKAGIMSIQTAHCKHGRALFLDITEERYYVKLFD